MAVIRIWTCDRCKDTVEKPIENNAIPDGWRTESILGALPYRHLCAKCVEKMRIVLERFMKAEL